MCFLPSLSLPSDQLDRCYISLRNGCRDDRLTLAARYRLLEVIELRAMHWQPNENLINYYKQKLVQIEASGGGIFTCISIIVFIIAGMVMAANQLFTNHFLPVRRKRQPWTTTVATPQARVHQGFSSPLPAPPSNINSPCTKQPPLPHLPPSHPKLQCPPTPPPQLSWHPGKSSAARASSLNRRASPARTTVRTRWWYATLTLARVCCHQVAYHSVVVANMVVITVQLFCL